MRIKILMMFKNEDQLLGPWIRYHKSIVGPDNLVVFDNGSTSTETLREIRQAEDSGIMVDRSRNSTSDFVAKGNIFSEVIKNFDSTDPADFYFPLDCDEFLAIDDNGVVKADRISILHELEKYKNATYPLAIGSGLDNSAIDIGRFRWARKQRKTFFAGGACRKLDHGFHSGESITGECARQTNVVYIHFHYKPINVLHAHSVAKLRPFTDDFSRSALVKYVEEKRSGYHCAAHLLVNEDEYSRMFDHRDYIEIPEVELIFSALGENIPFQKKI